MYDLRVIVKDLIIQGMVDIPRIQVYFVDIWYSVQSICACSYPPLNLLLHHSSVAVSGQ